MNLKARPIILHFTTNNLDGAQKFYSQFMGVEFARSLSSEHKSYHVPVSDDGILFTLSEKYKPTDQVTVYFAVQDLDAAVQDIVKAGGSVTVQKTDAKVANKLLEKYKQNYQTVHKSANAPESIGTMCEAKDPFGNTIGLIQLNRAAEPFFTGQTGPYSVSDVHSQGHQSAVALGKEL